MTKYVKVKFSNGDSFLIPAMTIAKNRAKYFASRDHGEIPSDQAVLKNSNWYKIYLEERDSTLEDEYELTDWLWNSMNWVDVEASAIKIEGDPEYSYADNWMDVQANEDYEIIEKED